MTKVIISGGRDFKDYLLLKFKCNKILSEISATSEVQIVSGGANGADQLGEKYAKEHHYIVKRFEADWNTHGNSAGFIRNEQMAKYADVCICFWNKKSRGTKIMIDLAEKYNLKLRIIFYA